MYIVHNFLLYNVQYVKLYKVLVHIQYIFQPVQLLILCYMVSYELGFKDIRLRLEYK